MRSEMPSGVASRIGVAAFVVSFGTCTIIGPRKTGEGSIDQGPY
jgi:hypothetical protein